MKVAAVLLLLGLVAMASASYYAPYFPKAVSVTTVHHGIGYGGLGGLGGYGYGGYGGFGRFSGFGGYGHFSEY